MTTARKAADLAKAIAVLALCAYTFYAWVRWGAYLGTAHFWSNEWCYKAHACLVAIFLARWILGKRPE